MAHNSLSNSLVYTKLQYRIKLCVNNVEVTVNTCTYTDVFTVITTKDQSGEI